MIKAPGQRILGWIMVGGLALVLGVIGYWLLFTQFMVYDDEGYVLWSLRSYCAEGGLYVKVFSQYGPFFYAYYDFLHSLTGLVFDHETGRFLTLFYWLGSAALCGFLVWRFTRHFTYAIGTSALTFTSLQLMTWEPIHPGGFLTFITALAVVLSTECLIHKRPLRFAAITGICGAMIMLTKINVGAFFIIAAGSWLGINASHQKLGRKAAWLVALGSLATPLILMHSHWSQPWAATYALIFCCSALTLITVIHDNRSNEFGLKPWAVWLASILGVVSIITMKLWSTGSDPATLLEGVVLAPFRHPSIYSFQNLWRFGARELAVASALLAILRHTWIRQRVNSTFFAILRIVIATVFFGTAVTAEEGSLHRFNFDYGPSLIWLMVLPLDANKTKLSGNQPRLWMAWMFIWQNLQAYPVAGSQASWGSFLWVPICISGGHEALAYLAERLSASKQRIHFIAKPLMVAVTAFTLWPMAARGHWRYQTGYSMASVGASRLRLLPSLASSLLILDENIKAYSKTLFSNPGMFSFNIWSNIPTPTHANATLWYSLLSESEQNAIVAKLKTDSEALVVANDVLLSLQIETGYTPKGVLYDYLNREFTPAFTIESYSLLVHRDRSIAPLSTARLINADPTDAHSSKLEFIIATLDCSVTSIELRQITPPHEVIQRISLSSLNPWQVTQLTSAGRAQGAATSHGVSFNVTTPSLISANFTPPAQLPPLSQIELHLLDEDNHTLRRVRFIN